MTVELVLNFLKIFAAVAVAVAIASLAFVIVRFNRKRVQIIRAARTASEAVLDAIYRLVEATGEQPSNGFVLARTNLTAGDLSCMVAIPAHVPDFPWAGQSISIQAEPDVHFQFVDGTGRATQLLGHQYRAVAVPRSRLKSGKARNRFDPKKYLKDNIQLRDRLAGVCHQYPGELLSYLLCAGGQSFEFEPIDQARIGTSAAWVQQPEFKYCPQCNKRMALILQMPGSLIHPKRLHEGTFFLFGCKTHPDQTASFGQFT